MYHCAGYSAERKLSLPRTGSSSHSDPESPADMATAACRRRLDTGGVDDGGDSSVMQERARQKMEHRRRQNRDSARRSRSKRKASMFGVAECVKRQAVSIAELEAKLVELEAAVQRAKQSQLVHPPPNSTSLSGPRVDGDDPCAEHVVMSAVDVPDRHGQDVQLRTAQVGGVGMQEPPDYSRLLGFVTAHDPTPPQMSPGSCVVVDAFDLPSAPSQESNVAQISQSFCPNPLARRHQQQERQQPGLPYFPGEQHRAELRTPPCMAQQRKQDSIRPDLRLEQLLDMPLSALETPPERTGQEGSLLQLAMSPFNCQTPLNSSCLSADLQQHNFTNSRSTPQAANYAGMPEPSGYGLLANSAVVADPLSRNLFGIASNGGERVVRASFARHPVRAASKFDDLPSPVERTIHLKPEHEGLQDEYQHPAELRDIDIVSLLDALTRPS